MSESDGFSPAGRMKFNISFFKQSFKKPAIILGGFILLIWLIEIVDSLILQGSLEGLGIKPRSLSGLPGILLMPLIHGDFGHLFANTLPFIILGGLVMLNGFSDFFRVSAIIIIISGLGVWLFGGSNSVHIGASGLIFGFFGYLVARAYFERSIVAIILAVGVFLIYGSLFIGVLPLKAGVSWLAHLFGFGAGVLAAYLISKRNRKAEEQTETDPLPPGG